MEAFSNQQVAVEQLPDYRQLTLSPMAPAFTTYSVLKTGLGWLLLTLLSTAPLVLSLSDYEAGLWPTALLAVLGLTSTLHSWRDARRRGWALREHDLVYRYGVLWRQTVILPFARIQHVESSSGPLERHFGLMRLKCFTAGGANVDLSVKGLDTGSGEKVRDYLLEQIRDDGGAAADGSSPADGSHAAD